MVKKQFFCVFVAALIFSTSSVSSAGNEGEYSYFLQSRNTTEVNTQFSPKIGLLNKKEESGIKSIGNYASAESAPKVFEKVNVEVRREDGEMLFVYWFEPQMIDPRAPLNTQIFRESTLGTHVYVVTPKEIFPVLYAQFGIELDPRRLKAADKELVVFDETNLFRVLKKYNSIIEEGLDSQKNDSSEMERAFDGSLDLLGQFGAVTKILKRIMAWALDKEEEKRERLLREKYGDSYNIYRLPLYVFDGADFRSISIGRKSWISFYSKNSKPTEVFIEIPLVSFELEANGVNRKMALDRLTYEVEITPNGIQEGSVYYLYGKWRKVPAVPNGQKGQEFIRISKYHLYEGDLDRRVKISKHESHEGAYVITYKEGKRSFERNALVMTENIIAYNGAFYLREGVKEERIASIDQFFGTWTFTDPLDIVIEDGNIRTEFTNRKGERKTDRSFDFYSDKVSKVDDFYIIRAKDKGDLKFLFLKRIDANNVIFFGGSRLYQLSKK